MPRATSGWDGGKRVGGRKRHVVVDCLGLVLTVLVSAASVQDRDAGVVPPSPGRRPASPGRLPPPRARPAPARPPPAAGPPPHGASSPGLPAFRAPTAQPPPRARRADEPPHPSHPQAEFTPTKPPTSNLQPHDHVRKAEAF
ncbi:transposase [Streptomyces phaeochromogenes]|uniref:transposase n=1 Tax=Streptomyces phaeochromogenes TaxID=1923 RepID=UPI0033F3B804